MDDETPLFNEMQRAWIVKPDGEEMLDFGMLLVSEKADGQIESVALWKANADQ